MRNYEKEFASLIPGMTEWFAGLNHPNRAKYIASGDSARELAIKMEEYAKQNQLKIPRIRTIDHKKTWNLYFANEISRTILRPSIVGGFVYFIEDFAFNGEKIWNFYNLMQQNLKLGVQFNVMVARPNIALPQNTNVFMRSEELADYLNAKYDSRLRNPSVNRHAGWQ